VTVSPGLKGFAGRKLAPFPSECDSSRPECLPVSEPVTLIPVRSFFDAPRKLIWVAGAAASLPSEGKTATGTLVPAEVLTSATMKSAAITTAPATKSLTRFDKAQIVASGVRPPDRRFRRRPLFILAARRQMRAIGALAGTVIVLGALVAPGWAVDPVHDSLIYCNGSLDGGASGAFTDREHTINVGDPPLPSGVRRKLMTIDGVSTPVMQSGPRRAREAVVFVHGNPGSSRDFDTLVAQTGRFARAVAFDVPGFGHANDRPGGPYTTRGAARFIEDLTRRLGIRRVHLVLHDFGGPWGLEWGVEHGDRLASVVLIDTGVFIGYYGHPAALVWHTPLAGEVQVATTTRQTFTGYLQANNPRPLPGRFVDRMYDDFDRGTRCAMLHYYRDISNPDQMGRRQAAALRRRVRPALVVWGARDPYVPASLAQTQKQAFPAAQIHGLQGDGHWPFVDEPRRVSRLVIPFLRRVVH